MSSPNDPKTDSAFEELGQPTRSDSDQRLRDDINNTPPVSTDQSQAQTTTDQPTDDDKAKHTALQCVALLARHHGIDVSADRLIHDYSLANEKPSLRKILRICKDSGIKARHARMTWKQLRKLGEGFPVMARLANENYVILVGMRDGQNEAGETIEEVAVFDPCLLYTSPSPRDQRGSRMPSYA